VGFCGILRTQAFSGIFLRFEFFLLPSRIHARPHAGNANRWAAGDEFMTRIQKFLFATSGLLVLLASTYSPVLLPYPLLVLAVLRGWHLPKISTPAVQLLFSTLICTLFLETSAWLDNFIKNVPDPALFHPQLFPDLIISFGVYSAWWLCWWLILRCYHFTAKQIFITTGLYGVLIEQQGKIFLAGLSTLPLGVVLWLFVAVAYGATMALAFFLVRNRFTATNNAWMKYPLAWGGLFFFTIATSSIWGIALQIMNIIPPEKLPMWEYPLW
jgi:hypothetical protein